MSESIHDRVVAFPSGQSILDQINAARDELGTADKTLDGASAALDYFGELLALLELLLRTVEKALLTETLLGGFVTQVSECRSAVANYIASDPTVVRARLSSFADVVRLNMPAVGEGDVAVLSTAEIAAVKAAEDIAAQLAGLAAQRDQLQSQIDELKQGAMAQFEAHGTEMDDLLKDAALRMDEVAKEGRRQYDEDRSVFVRVAQETSDSADSLLAQLREKLAIAGNESMSANYGNRADIEVKEADRLREKAENYGRLTVLAGVVAVVLQVVSAVKDWKVDAWATWPAKLTVIAGLAAMSSYFGRQAAAHRRYSQQLRNAQLELHNLGSYLAELEPATRGQVRIALVTSFFGKAIPTVQDDSPTTGAAASQMLQAVLSGAPTPKPPLSDVQ